MGLKNYIVNKKIKFKSILANLNKYKYTPLKTHIIEKIHTKAEYNHEILKYNTANIKTKIIYTLKGFVGGIGISSICLALTYAFYNSTNPKTKGYDLKAEGFSPTAYKVGMATYVAIILGTLTTNQYHNIAEVAIAFNLLTSSVVSSTVLNEKYNIAPKVKKVVETFTKIKQNLKGLFLPPQSPKI